MLVVNYKPADKLENLTLEILALGRTLRKLLIFFWGSKRFRITGKQTTHFFPCFGKTSFSVCKQYWSWVL